MSVGSTAVGGLSQLEQFLIGSLGIAQGIDLAAALPAVRPLPSNRLPIIRSPSGKHFPLVSTRRPSGRRGRPDAGQWLPGNYVRIFVARMLDIGA
jgi:hypothetical protein